MAIQVISSCTIENDEIIVNGDLLFSIEDEVLSEFLKLAYRHLNLSYPKFFKMDKLCQLAFLGTEYLLKDNDITFTDDDVALCFFNGQSSLDTDAKHQHLINEGTKVSPAVFVYTLPNIMMGEIAIKNKWYGENLLILRPDFNFEEWALEADLLISSGKAKYCLGGWVDVFQDNYQVQLYLVEAAGIKMKLTSI
ncbi:3-oxoacyl-ACP synthase [uncultured Algoriphagus sp.]|uniref:3-oxoacyl-ACP synthase n=1 Tax=uncultured Algoriphagus sp. TaxID=417365 RepID=UPI0030EEC073|tara:strand:+ start:68779 stop:69360 length:582 start_codon:yes stop_codon:yes gene_type:complete